MPSAYSVPMASEVLPDPDTPTTATVRHSGTSTSISRRLLCRAPRTLMTAGRVVGPGISTAAMPGNLRPSVPGWSVGAPFAPRPGRRLRRRPATPFAPRPGRRLRRPATPLLPAPGAGARSGPGTLWSGVDRSADAEPRVEAQRLHDLECRGVGELRDVGGGQH